jgi:hypothetical protein
LEKITRQPIPINANPIKITINAVHSPMFSPLLFQNALFTKGINKIIPKNHIFEKRLKKRRNSMLKVKVHHLFSRRQDDPMFPVCA